MARLARETTPNSGASGVSARPSRRCSAALQDRLAGEVGGVVARGQVRVGRRIPDPPVGAVQDAEQPTLRRPCREQSLQAAAFRRPLDLRRKGRADGGDPVGVKEPGLEEAELPPELRAVDSEHPLRQAQRRKRGRREQPLIGEVVDRDHRRRAPPRCPAGGRRRPMCRRGTGGRALGEKVEIERRQPRLPVVGVDQVGPPPVVGTPWPAAPPSRREGRIAARSLPGWRRCRPCRGAPRRRRAAGSRRHRR